ncbi:hypothetical protein K474DRAFT_1666393 [Panus rudis PR-1116 ss-1]|nr:hypothetical protein K474DRAFT_1666393 [Panus rudis PR-1116 ss-1]
MSTEDVQSQLDQVIAYTKQPLDNTAQEAATSRLLDTIRDSDQKVIDEIIALAQ